MCQLDKSLGLLMSKYQETHSPIKSFAIWIFVSLDNETDIEGHTTHFQQHNITI